MNEQQLHLWRSLVHARGGRRAFRVDRSSGLARTKQLHWLASRPSLSAPVTAAERHHQFQRLIDARRPSR